MKEKHYKDPPTAFMRKGDFSGVCFVTYRFVSTSSGYKPYWPSPGGACPTEGRVLHRFP